MHVRRNLTICWLVATGSGCSGCWTCVTQCASTLLHFGGVFQAHSPSSYQSQLLAHPTSKAIAPPKLHCGGPPTHCPSNQKEQEAILSSTDGRLQVCTSCKGLAGGLPCESTKVLFISAALRMTRANEHHPAPLLATTFTPPRLHHPHKGHTRRNPWKHSAGRLVDHRLLTGLVLLVADKLWRTLRHRSARQ